MLLAYSDPKASAASALLSFEHRDRLALCINQAILGASESALEKCTRQLIVVSGVLKSLEGKEAATNVRELFELA